MESLYRSAGVVLAEWHAKAKRKPLVIRGARQVGKSTLVRDFARARGLRLAEVNLERHTLLEPCFRRLEIPAIRAEIEAITERPLAAPDTLLFLDEIQATPSAFAALRYLHEELPRLAMVAAGSLLEFVLREPGFSVPVGRIEYLHLGPMGFGEFLRALGEMRLIDLIEGWEPGAIFAEAAHRRLLECHRQFLFTGGMPEAVADYAANRHAAAVKDIHRSIADTYRDDFAKYAGGGNSLLRLQRVFDYVPSAVGQKIKYANIGGDERARDLRKAIDQLAAARVIWRVHHSDCSGLPLEAQLDPDIYKCLFLDVGLMNHVCGLDWAAIRRRDERRLANEGGLAEQFVGQHLLFRERGREQPSLCYWLREGKRDNAEVDYVIARGDWIVPVEVKAGSAGSLKSLAQFLARKIDPVHQPRVALRFDLNPPTLAEHEHQLTSTPPATVSYMMLSLPAYMVEQAGRLFDILRDRRPASPNRKRG
jgi:predicted AAA+ superfamily ATPase